MKFIKSAYSSVALNVMGYFFVVYEISYLHLMIFTDSLIAFNKSYFCLNSVLMFASILVLCVSLITISRVVECVMPSA